MAHRCLRIYQMMNEIKLNSLSVKFCKFAMLFGLSGEENFFVDIQPRIVPVSKRASLSLSSSTPAAFLQQPDLLSNLPFLPSLAPSIQQHPKNEKLVQTTPSNGLLSFLNLVFAVLPLVENRTSSHFPSFLFGKARASSRLFTFEFSTFKKSDLYNG